MRRVFAILAMIPIATWAQEFDLLGDIQEIGDSVYWESPSIYDRYNLWDNTERMSLGLSVNPAIKSFDDIRQLSLSVQGPRALYFGFGDYSNPIHDVGNAISGSLDKWRASEVVATRAGQSYVPTELISDFEYGQSVFFTFSSTNLNRSLFPAFNDSIKEHRVRLEEKYREDTKEGSHARRTSRNKIYSIAVGVKYVNRHYYSIYSDNGLNPEGLIPDQGLYTGYSHHTAIYPTFGIVIHPRYFFCKVLYDSELNKLDIRAGITIPIKR